MLKESQIPFSLIKKVIRLVGGLRNISYALNMDASFQCLCSNLTSRQFERKQSEGRGTKQLGQMKYILSFCWPGERQ